MIHNSTHILDTVTFHTESASSGNPVQVPANTGGVLTPETLLAATRDLNTAFDFQLPLKPIPFTLTVPPRKPDTEHTVRHLPTIYRDGRDKPILGWANDQHFLNALAGLKRENYTFDLSPPDAKGQQVLTCKPLPGSAGKPLNAEKYQVTLCIDRNNWLTSCRTEREIPFESWNACATFQPKPPSPSSLQRILPPWINTSTLATQKNSNWFHAPITPTEQTTSTRGTTMPLVIQGRLLAAPVWHALQSEAAPAVTAALDALLKPPHDGLQEHSFSPASGTGQFRFTLGQRQFHASYTVGKQPGSPLVCSLSVSNAQGEKLAEFGGQAGDSAQQTGKPANTLKRLRHSRTFSNSPAYFSWSTWQESGLNFEAKLIKLQGDRKLQCIAPSELTEIIPLTQRELAVKAMEKITKEGRVVEDRLQGSLRFYDLDNALKGTKYFVEFRLSAQESEEASQDPDRYEMRSLTVKDAKRQVLLRADLDAPAKLSQSGSTAKVDLSVAPLSEEEKQAYLDHMDKQEAALLRNASSPYVITACIAAINKNAQTPCMLHENVFAVNEYLKNCPAPPEYVVSVVADSTLSKFEHDPFSHFTTEIVHKKADGTYAMVFIDPRGKVENTLALSAAEAIGAKAAIQAWLHVQNDGENCAHFASRFAEHALQEDMRAEFIAKLDELIKGSLQPQDTVTRTLTGFEEASFFVPVQFFKEIQWSDVLEKLTEAHRKAGDGWNEAEISTKSLDGNRGMNIEEYYHYNKERLGEKFNQSISLKSQKDRKEALEHIRTLRAMPDSGASAWKEDLVRMSPWYAPDGQVTDRFVGKALYEKHNQIEHDQIDDESSHGNSSDDSLDDLFALANSKPTTESNASLLSADPFEFEFDI